MLRATNSFFVLLANEVNTMNGIQGWLGNLSKDQFMDDHFHKLPIAMPGGAESYTDLCDWNLFGRILGEAEVDVMVCRDGEPYQGTLPANQDDAERLSRDGYTILVRHAEVHDARLRQLAESFSVDFAGQVNIHIYATPADHHGFSWHYDAEDVFILQTVGAKEYSLRKNTVHPWPLIETIPQNMRYERETMPMMQCLLRAGDWLYIPMGYWHMATAHQASLSLAIGVLSPSALDIYDFARQRLAESLVWRQRLSVDGAASTLGPQQRRDAMREVLGQLTRDLTDLYQSEAFLDALVEHFS
jgi:ribosomal protein L16 Arg81 hydroxylase